jgi:hypothetical protein
MSVLSVPLAGALARPSPQYLDTAARDETSVGERACLLLVRDLLRLGWRWKPDSSRSLELVPPAVYDKGIVRAAMAYARNECIAHNATWIGNHLGLAKANLASGEDVLGSPVIPRIEVCSTQRQNDLFRLLRYYWSSPSSDYVGRRMRFLIRDEGITGSPVIGIAALGSSIIHIPARDKWIRWSTATRTDRIIYIMDAFVVGALPPYNDLLGGKLISYLLASNEIRSMYAEKYASQQTIIKSRTASDLAMMVTTSLYGSRSSQYNRLRYGKSLLYRPIGHTSGYGSLHISGETFEAMRQLVQSDGCIISNRFGDGPNWRIRVIRTACDMLGLNSDVILKHSFQRGLYAIPLTTNFRAFLTGKSEAPRYRNLPLVDLADHWRERWLTMRKQNEEVVSRVRRFSPEEFTITASDIEA